MPFLFSLIAMLILIGLLYWLVTLLPLPEPVKTIITMVVILICILYVMGILAGYAPPFPVMRHY